MARVRKKQVFQCIAFAAPDRLLHGRQIFGEALQDIQRRLAVIEKNIAPHHRVGRGNAGKIPEPGGRIFQDLTAKIVFQVRCRADNGVGDEGRQMRGDGQNPVVMTGRHNIDHGAHVTPQRCDCIRRRRVCGL